MKKYIITIIIASLVLTGCSLTSEKIEEEQKQEKTNNTELKLLPVSEKEIELDQMYVKTGDEYYKTMTDFDYYFDNSEKPSNDRHIFLKDNDVLVPTLFKDDVLIYNTTSLIPEKFELERFEDVGYSFGMFGLDMIYLNKIQLRYDDDHIVYGTSFAKLFEGYEDDTIFLLDKLNGKKIDSSFITRSGTIKDLTYGKEYELEYYLGSNYIKQKAIADVHIFTSFEVYNTSDFKFNTDSKLKINMPKELPSGYYLINGQYFIRYCNRLRKEGIKDVNFNVKREVDNVDITVEN